jgi:hypothetical protein
VTAGRHRGLPYLSFGQFAVTDEVDAPHFAHVRMVAEGAAEPGVGVQIDGGEVAEIGQDRKQADRGVPFAQHEPVPVRPVWR